MDSYLDSSFLYKLYVNEKNSAEAVAWFRAYKGDIALSELSDVEIVSSLYRNFPPEQAAQAHEIYSGDCVLGVYRRLTINQAVYTVAESIAKQYGHDYGLRSLDILHLATAVCYGVPTFGTFDIKQSTAARALGLIVWPERS